MRDQDFTTNTAPNPGDPQHEPGLTKAELFAAKGLDPDIQAPWLVRDGRGRMGTPIVTWPVPNVDGTPAFWRERWRLEKRSAKDSDRFRQPPGVPVMPYGLSRLRFLRPTDPILLVEGETDVWTLYQYGVTAIGIPGTSTFKPEHAAMLGDRPTYLWREPGAKAGELETRVTKAIPHVRVIDAPEGIKDPNEAHLKGVLSQPWLSDLAERARPGVVGSAGAGGGWGYEDGDGFDAAEYLQHILDSLKGGQGAGASPNGAHTDLGDGDLIVIRASDVVPQKVEFLWDRRIVKGKINILDGDPGVGKSGITMRLVAHETTGEPYPDDRNQARREPGNVVVICAEDDPADTIVPRLIAAGADLNRVSIVQMTKTKKGERVFDVTQDLPKLEALADELHPTLIVVDPIVSHVGDANPNRSIEMRQALAPVAILAAKIGAAVVICRHLNKQNGVAALYRGSGSIDIVGIARSVMLAAEDKQGNCFLVRTKSNLAAKPLAIRYLRESVDDVLRIEWAGTADIDADDLLNGDGDAKSPEQQNIVEALTKQKERSRATLGVPDTMTPKEIHAAVKGEYQTVRRNLSKMEKRGLVEKVSYGLYRVPDDGDEPEQEQEGGDEPARKEWPGADRNPFDLSNPPCNTGNSSYSGNTCNSGNSSEAEAPPQPAPTVAAAPTVASVATFQVSQPLQQDEPGPRTEAETAADGGDTGNRGNTCHSSEVLLADLIRRAADDDDVLDDAELAELTPLGRCPDCGRLPTDPSKFTECTAWHRETPPTPATPGDEPIDLSTVRMRGRDKQT